MAAPERFAEMSDSSCTAGAVHTWHFSDINAMSDLSLECRPKRTSANLPESLDSHSQSGEKLRLLGCEFFR